MTAAKKFWIATVANVLAAGLLGLVLYAMMLALAVIAPEISSWPLFTVVLTGLVLSIVALRFTRPLASRGWRISGYLLHGGILTINAAILLGSATLYVGSTAEKFLIPEGYKGDVYVIYNASDGVPEKRTRWQVTYAIPADGVLRTRGSMIRNFTKPEYFYQRPDGTLEKIRNFWPVTIPETPENLANDKDVGVFFPRTGAGNYSDNCAIAYDQFYVGTKAFLLTRYKGKDLSEYVREHPGACTGKAEALSKH
ncbi:MAG TPA: hypothetical protein VF753_01315 [Terriglobales bacterium]